MGRSLVSGAVRVKMSIMVIANFVILRYDVTMLEKHNCCSIVQRKKHIEATKHSLDEKQTKLQFTCEIGRKSTPSTSRAISLTFPGDDSLKAETLWLLKLAVSNFSLRSTDKLGELFQTLFLDSKIAAGFTLSQAKSSYVISHGFSQYFTLMLVKDVF